MLLYLTHTLLKTRAFRPCRVALGSGVWNRAFQWGAAKRKKRGFALFSFALCAFAFVALLRSFLLRVRERKKAWAHTSGLSVILVLTLSRFSFFEVLIHLFFFRNFALELLAGEADYQVYCSAWKWRRFSLYNFFTSFFVLINKCKIDPHSSVFNPKLF